MWREVVVINKEVQFKRFCPLVKTVCPPSENVYETPGIQSFT